MRLSRISLFKLPSSCMTLQEADVDLAALVDDRHLELTLTRSVFEDMCTDLFDKCLNQIDRLLADPAVPDAWPPSLKARH